MMAFPNHRRCRHYNSFFKGPQGGVEEFDIDFTDDVDNKATSCAGAE